MNALTEQEQEQVESVLPKLKLKMLARQIQDNDHLTKVLKDSDPSMRKVVYEEIKPHLTFKCKPFYLLKFK